MKDIFGSLERVLLEITIGTFCRPTYLPRLARLHILCDERCDFNWIGFLHRCRFVQAEATKELWLKTPVKPVHIKKILEVAGQGRVRSLRVEQVRRDVCSTSGLRRAQVSVRPIKIFAWGALELTNTCAQEGPAG